MNRRAFLGIACAAAIAPMLPASAIAKLPANAIPEFFPVGFFAPLVTLIASDPNVTRILLDLGTDKCVRQLTVNGVLIPELVANGLWWRQHGRVAQVMVPNELLSGYSEPIAVLVSLRD